MENNEQQKPRLPEVWMRGPVSGVPDLLQPVAHALLQAAEEIELLMKDFPDDMLWEKPAGVASPAFHLQHIPGVLDRLYTYAKGEQLGNAQLKYLSEEGLQVENLKTQDLVDRLKEQISGSIAYLKTVDPATLADYRGVGRKQLPSTVLGLLFHAAEHTMRHMGQLLVTVRILGSET